MNTKYIDPPVIEAVFEIRFPAELSIESQRDKYYEKIREYFPDISVPKVESPEPYPLKPYRFETSDKLKMIQFSINRFSFHTKKYNTFNEFNTEVINYIESFCELYRISKLNRTGLRYINHIPIERENGVLQISKYLKFGYILPDIIPSNLELFQTVLLSRIEEGKLRILIASQNAIGTGDGEIMVLDFDFFFEGDLSVDLLKNYLQNSHIHTKKVFESLISKEYRSIPEKGD